MNDKLPEETSRTVPDETTNNVNLEGGYPQTRSESDNGSVAKPPDTGPAAHITIANKTGQNRTYGCSTCTRTKEYEQCKRQ